MIESASGYWKILLEIIELLKVYNGGSITDMISINQNCKLCVVTTTVCLKLHGVQTDQQQDRDRYNLL